MVRIDTTDTQQKWKFACPHPKRHRDWRVTDGMFECLSCKRTYDELVNLKSGETVARDDMEFVGPHADHKGAFGRPKSEGI